MRISEEKTVAAGEIIKEIFYWSAWFCGGITAIGAVIFALSGGVEWK